MAPPKKILALLLSILALPSLAEQRATVEEIFEKHRGGAKLSFYEINRLNSECRLVPGTERAFVLGGKPLSERIEDKPVLVYLDGDAGWITGGRFKILSEGHLDAKALKSNGESDPDRVELAKMICKDQALRFGSFGLATVILARPGAIGSPGNYGTDIYSERETNAVSDTLDDLRSVGAKSFIIYGFSGGA